jgi:hypothetical protein
MNKYSIFNEEYKLLYEVYYNDINSFSLDEFIRIKKDGLIGCIDKKNGNLIIEAVYDEIGYFKNEHVISKKNGFYGILNRNGEEVAPHVFDKVSFVFSNKYFGIKKKKCALYSIDGSIINEYYDEMNVYGNFLIVKKNDVWGVLDNLGNEIVACIYDGVIGHSSEYLIVVKNGLEGHINNNFELTIQCLYQNIGFLSNEYNYRKVKKNNLFGLLNEKNIEVIECKYDEIKIFNSSHIVIEKNGFYGIIDFNENIIIEAEFDEIIFIKGSLFGARIKNSWSIYNLAKELISKYKYQKIKKNTEGYIPVRRNKKWGFVNEKGVEEILCEYNEVTNFFNGFAFVKTNEQWEVINYKNEKIKNLIIDEFQDLWENPDFRNELLVIKKDNKYGLLDSSYKIIFDLKYDKIYNTGTFSNCIIAKLEGKYCVLNFNQNIMIDNIYDEIEKREDIFICTTKNVDTDSIKLHKHKENQQTFDKDFIVNFYNRKFLRSHTTKLSENIIRISILSLVELNENYTSNRLYLIDVAKNDGSTSSFIQGYAGGGSCSECLFWNDKLINESSDAYDEDDENIKYEYTIHDLPESMKDLIKPYICELHEDDEDYSFKSLDNFKKIPNDNMYVSYNVWIDESVGLKSLWENDRERLKIMIKKSGLTLTDPTNWS